MGLIVAAIVIILAYQILTHLNKSETEGNWEKYSDSDITLDWYVNFSWFVQGWGENLVSRAITDETGVNINFITPVGDESDKMDALIASDSLPDLITLGWWQPQINEMIEGDMVYALNDLADKYDPYFYEVADKNVVEWYTQEDGNIYCYPNSSYTPDDLEEHDNIPSNQTFLVRKDIYEALGSPDMSTPEGFSQAVRKAKEMYPTVNGEPLIPIGAHPFDSTGCVSFDQYLQNFLAIPWEKDGMYYDRYTDPEYIKWLKMFRKLGKDGYLTTDIFVDNRTQMSEKIANGRYFCMIYQRTDLADQQKILYERDPNSIYIAVDGPKNANGDDPVLPSNGITGWTVTLISKNCKDPERAIAFLDYMISERGQELIYLGVEGVTYDNVDGKIKIRPEVKYILNSDRETYDSIYGADDTYWMLQNNVMQLKWGLEMEEPLKQMAEWTYPYTTYLGQYEMQMFSSNAVKQAYDNCNRLWGVTLKELLLADSDEEFDKILESYKEKRESNGFSMVIDEETKQMRRNKEKLGIK
ncbi:MAG: extracellular solute-binding protein [Lachnospiraceae bacterium]|nr:extracellular solute-binding protein [Lachnospiraceae bacterium]